MDIMHMPYTSAWSPSFTMRLSINKVITDLSCTEKWKLYKLFIKLLIVCVDTSLNILVFKGNVKEQQSFFLD